MLFLFLKFFLTIIVATIIIVSFFLFRKRPLRDSDWSLDQKILPIAEFKADGKILIKNVRHVSYKTATDYEVSYYDREYDLNKLKKVWISLVHFTGYKYAAHTFLSFEFENDVFVSISVEIRKKKGEKYSAVKGLFRQFELMYVIADERDVIRLRTDHHKDNLFLYPLRFTKEQSQELFLDMLKRSNELSQNPEFYHSISNACFGNIVKHINHVVPGKIPFNYRIILPENADQYIHALNIIDTELPFQEIRKKHIINHFAKEHGEDPDFSLKIRGK